MINTNNFNIALGKVINAAGRDDLVQVLFTKAGEGRNMCQLTCCDGKGLQIMTPIAFTGESAEGIAIVKASTLSGITRSYEALGFSEFAARIVTGETENVLVLSNGKGEHKLPLAEKMPRIDLKAAQEGAQYAALCRTKDIQNAVKGVAYAMGNNEYTAGVFFQPCEKGFTLMATDTIYGTQGTFSVEFKMFGEGEPKEFFAGTSAIKVILPS